MVVLNENSENVDGNISTGEEEPTSDQATDSQDNANTDTVKDSQNIAEPFTLSASDLFNQINIVRTTRNRVKLYIHLDNQTAWDDRGTGHVQCLVKDEPNKQHFIHFRREDEDSICHDWAISESMEFMKQQDTLIIFSPCEEYEAALSFQNKEGADVFWNCICGLIGRDPSDEGEVEVSSSNCSDEDSVDGILPPVKLSTLAELVRITTLAQKSAVLKEKVAVALEKNNWIDGLKNIYDVSNDLTDDTSMIEVGDVVRNLLMLNREDYLFDKSNLKLIIQLLSHIPDDKHPIDHAEFLYEKAILKQVITINEPSTLEKIQRAFNIQYIVDVCLPPRLSAAIAPDDSWASAIDNYLTILRSSILNDILNEKSFETELICGLKTADLPVPRRREMVSFLKEFVSMVDTRIMNAVQKKRIMELFFAMNVFQCLLPCLATADYTIRKGTIDIIFHITNYDVKEILDFIQEDSIKTNVEEPFIMTEILRMILYDPDPELQMASTVMEIVRNLLGTDDPAPEYPTERQLFLGTFFKRSFHIILDTYQSSRKTALVINLMIACTKARPSIARIHIIKTGVLNSLATAVSSKHSCLVLSALKLLKAIVSLNDPMYNKHLLSCGAVNTTLNVFCEKYMYANNMYNSSFLDLFEIIARGGYDDILKGIWEIFGEKLENLTYCPTFDLMKSRFNRLSRQNISPRVLPKKDDDDDFSDNEEATCLPTIDIHDSDFKPMSPIKKQEYGGFSSSLVRPPTPMRIVIKLSHQDLENVHEKNEDSIETPFEKLEPMRLVDYDDSDNDEPSSEDEGDANNSSSNVIKDQRNEVEQRGTKRRSSVENEDDGEVTNQPKRVNLNLVTGI